MADAALEAGPISPTADLVGSVVCVLTGWVMVQSPIVLAEVSDTVALLGAVGTFLTVVLAALGGWWLKIKQQNANTARQVKRDDTAEERRQRRDEIGELYKIIAIKDKDHEDNRQQIHDLRDEMQRV